MKLRNLLLIGFVLLVAAPLMATSHWPEMGDTGLCWRGWFPLILFTLTFLALIKEFLPPEIILLITALILVFTGIVTPEEFLTGFSEDIIFSIAMLCIVVRAMEKSGLMTFIAKNVLSKSKNYLLQLLSIMIPVGMFSAFLNNTPIVLLMTSVVRRWASERHLKPSKYLIPLSYAAILGGVCTLIGTSSTLVVDGLLRSHKVASGLTLFEISWVGVPVALAGMLYLLTIGHRLLPERPDPTASVVEQTPDFTAEFEILSGCDLMGRSIAEAGEKYFPHELLIEIERDGYQIDSPNPEEVLYEGDRLVFAGEIHQIAELHAIPRLRSLADPHFHLDVTSPKFSEIVISVTSLLVGKTLKQAHFRTRHGASVLAVYREGRRVRGSVGEIVLRAGDTLMLLSKESWKGGEGYTNDFFTIRQNQELTLFSLPRFLWVTSILGAMIGSFMLWGSLVMSTLGAASILMVTRSVTIKEAKESIRWSLLVLIATAFSMATALEKTGVADFFAYGILKLVGYNNPTWLIATIFIASALVTELITNNAAVVLLFPIAMQTARLAGFDTPSAMKAVGVTIAVAASCAFATPIGYQTNMIVYGPGGYRFSDYMKVGIPLTILIFIISVFVIPAVWPLVPSA